ncbi:hypothetical protein V6N12_064687 [Hibiscus sabdariffa]|uniref:Ku70/Ku80 N-terminal alpha/beta domain-containing protein n=1 Tax=Hibiscus sabdariffa TaxID=183260 RepID=A0ABR2G6R6_9ROSI
MSFFVIGHFSQSQNLGFESEKEKFYSEFPDEGRRLSTIMVAIRGALLKHLRVSATSLPFLRNPNPTPNGLFALSSTNLRSPIASSMLSKSSRKLILPSVLSKAISVLAEFCSEDAQDLGISIEFLPLSRPDSEFNVSVFYADLIGFNGQDLAQFTQSASPKLEDMKDQLRKCMFTKRIIRKIEFHIIDGLSIELNTYALSRPIVPGASIYTLISTFIEVLFGALVLFSAFIFFMFQSESCKTSISLMLSFFPFS